MVFLFLVLTIFLKLFLPYAFPGQAFEIFIFPAAVLRNA